MINQAMFYNPNEFNEFTGSLRTLCQTSNGAQVQLRNRSIVRVYFEPAADEDTACMFRSADWSQVWRPDGSSVTSRDLDIVAQGVDIKPN